MPVILQRRSILKAVVKYGVQDGEVALRDVPEPEIGPGDVLLETQAAGVCGSDIEMWRHHITFSVTPPVTLGHEFGGIVAQVGAEVEGFAVGDRVVSETAFYICETCEFCRAGEYNLCPRRLGFGARANGAFARFVRVPARCLHYIPEGVPFESAALTEPACVAYNALVVKSRIAPGDFVVILGPGPIGLFALQVARLCGAGKTIITGTGADRMRLQIAEKLGADYVVDAERTDAVAEIDRITKGRGAPLVVDAAGSSETLRQSLEIVRRNGQITKIGWGPRPVGFSLDTLLLKAAALQGSFSHTWRTWENVLRLIASGQIQMSPMITHRMSIAEWNRAYHLVEERQAGKIILHPE